LRIHLEAFKGIAPRIEPHRLADNAAQQAQNCLLDSGSIRPLKDASFVASPTKAGTIKSLFKYGEFWFNWINDVSCLRSPTNDTEDMVVFTGEGVPKLTYASIATAGGDYPSASYELGTPIPTTAPAATVAGAASGDDPTDRTYFVTFICTYAGLQFEGAPSDPSNRVTVNPGQSVNVTLPSTPAGNYIFTHKVIYRTVGDTIRRMATVAHTATDWTDTYETGDLGVDLVTDNWYPPPDDLTGLVSLPGGVMAGISGKQVCFSVPYQPHAWPPDWRRIARDTPVALGAFGNTLVVLTDGQPEVGVGTSDPENLFLERVEMDQACIAPRAVVDLGYVVAFPSPDGLFLVGQGVTRNATEQIFRKEQWQPPVFGAAHDEKYFGFRESGGFVFDPRTGDWIEHDITATAAWRDPATDKLYIVTSGGIMQWEGGSAKTFVWKSKLFRVPPGSFASIRVEGGPVTVTHYQNGIESFSASIQDEVLRLPSGEMARKHEIKLEGNTTVDAVTIGSSVMEVR